jgi:histone deacetylase 1/2
VLLSGQSNDGLYVLSKSSATTIPQAYWSPYVSVTVDMWHRRLGHSTSCIFNLLVSKNKLICTSRRSGKSLRLSLRPTGDKTTAPLDLIFSDGWGPAPMFSSDGFCYFVIFIDAHTKYIWYYPLVAKSDVFSIFQHFQVLVEHQFSSKIKYVQID